MCTEDEWMRACQGKNPTNFPYGDDHKAEVNMQARAALAGCAIYRLAGGEFLLTKWGLSKSCPDLRSIGVLLDRLGGAA